MTQALIFDALRTPRGKGKADGALHSVKPVNLVAGLLTALQQRTALDTSQVDDVVLGCVTPIGDQGSDIAKTAALGFDVVDRPEAITAVADRVASIKGRIRALTTVRRLEGEPPAVEIELEVEGVTETDLVAALEGLDDVREVHLTRARDPRIGKGTIRVGGGPQGASVLGTTAGLAAIPATKVGHRDTSPRADVTAIVSHSSIRRRVRPSRTSVVAMACARTLASWANMVSCSATCAPAEARSSPSRRPCALHDWWRRGPAHPSSGRIVQA